MSDYDQDLHNLPMLIAMIILRVPVSENKQVIPFWALVSVLRSLNVLSGVAT